MKIRGFQRFSLVQVRLHWNVVVLSFHAFVHSRSANWGHVVLDPQITITSCLLIRQTFLGLLCYFGLLYRFVLLQYLPLSYMFLFSKLLDVLII